MNGAIILFVNSKRSLETAMLVKYDIYTINLWEYDEKRPHEYPPQGNKHKNQTLTRQ